MKKIIRYSSDVSMSSPGSAPEHYDRGHWGYINKEGKLIIPPIYTSASMFKEGLALIGIGQEGDYGKGSHLYGFIDKTGKVVIEIKFPGAGDFSNGLAPAQEPRKLFSSGKKWGFIDKSGEFVIKPKFNHATSFSEGLAAVTNSKNKIGYIDKTGKLIIEFKYYEATAFSKGLAKVAKEGADVYIDKSGKEVSKPDIKNNNKEIFHDGLAIVNVGDDNNGPYGYKNRKGEMVIRAKFTDHVLPFSEGLAAVEIRQKWGFIDKKGELIIDPEFDQAEHFSEGLAYVWSQQNVPGSNYSGYIDKNGKMRISNPEKYRTLKNFSDGMAAVEIREKDNTRFVFIDKNEKVLIDYAQGKKGKEEIREADSFSEGMAAVFIGKKWGYINKQGKVVIEPNYDYAKPFSEGLAQIQIASKWGYIDKQGKILVKPKYDETDSFSDGMAVVQENGERGFIDKSGKEIIKPRYKHALSFSEGLAVVQIKKEKNGFIDKTGKLVIEARYGFADSFSEGLAPVLKGEKHGYINKKGDFVIEPRFYNAGRFKDGLAIVEIENKNGTVEYMFIDKTGKPVITDKYGWDYPESFSNGMAPVLIGKANDYFGNPNFLGNPGPGAI